MKVAFFSYMPLTYWGGLEKYLTKTSRELTDRYPDLEIDVVTADANLSRKIHFWHGLYFGQLPGREKLERESLEAVLHQLGPHVRYRRVSSLKRFRTVLRDYDVIYSKNELIEAFILKYRIGYGNISPVIFGCHTAIYYPSKSATARLHNFLYAGPVFRNLANGVRTFQVLNQADEAVLRRQFPSKNIQTIPNPFDFNSFTLQAKYNQLNLTLPKGKIHILWVGRLSIQKGIDELVRVIRKVSTGPEGNRFSWTIAGEGPLKEKVLAAAEAWNHVHYIGHVDSVLMASLYSQHDIFISTSKWESFGFSVIEAQCFGLPVVAFNLPAFNETIVPNLESILVAGPDELSSRLELMAKQNMGPTENIKRSVRKKFDHEIIYDRLHSLIAGQTS
jgi:glycosyltransferase involved in cell wall biosynthesis